MSDPRFWLVDTETVFECDVCETPNKVTVWDNPRTGRWEYDPWTCVCGEHHRGDNGNSYDRGATNALTSIITLGVLLIIGALAAMFFTPATLIHQVVILTGAGLIAGACGVAAFAWLKQNGIS